MVEMVSVASGEGVSAASVDGEGVSVAGVEGERGQCCKC